MRARELGGQEKLGRQKDRELERVREREREKDWQGLGRRTDREREREKGEWERLANKEQTQLWKTTTC